MPLPHELVPPDNSHSWRYAGRNGKYPAPDGIRLTIDLIGEGQIRRNVIEQAGLIFCRMNEGFFSIHNPANGGYAGTVIERGLIRRIEIAAI